MKGDVKEEEEEEVVVEVVVEEEERLWMIISISKPLFFICLFCPSTSFLIISNFLIDYIPLNLQLKYLRIYLCMKVRLGEITCF